MICLLMNGNLSQDCLVCNMEKKVEFQNTSQFIFRLTSERLRKKKENLGLTLYQIAGFSSKKSYYDAESYEREYNIDVISKIMNNDRKEKKTKYLIPAKYQTQLTKTLKFSSIHEMLWGGENEIRKYLEDIFLQIFQDGMNSNNIIIETSFADLVNNLNKVTINVPRFIYNNIKDKLFDEFLDFTKAINVTNLIFPIIGTNKWIFDERKSKVLDGTELNEHLGYKNLNDALESFTEKRIVPLLKIELLKLF